MKKWIVTLCIAGLIIGCTTNNNKSETETFLTISQFVSRADSLTDSIVTVRGKVSHVCRKDGMKMFLTDSSKASVKIVPGPNMSPYDTALEGRTVEIKGKVLLDYKIDEAYLADWEKSLAQTDSSGNVHHHGQHSGDLEEIVRYRQQLKDKSLTHITFYQIESVVFKLIPDSTAR